jgi:hypothetical protein
MDVEGILAIVLIFGGGTLWLLSLSPVGKALAERIRAPAAPGAAGAAGDVRGELEAVRAELLSEVQQLRTEVSELNERLDFAERLLAKGRDAERLGPAS